MSPKAEPKLRASCDGCYTAKLKCSKEKPTCPRCRGLGLICHYSPTLRTGKPRATRTQTQPQLLYLSHLPQSSQVTQASGWTVDGTTNKAQSIATTKPHIQSAAEASQPLFLENPSSRRSESSFSTEALRRLHQQLLTKISSLNGRNIYPHLRRRVPCMVSRMAL